MQEPDRDMIFVEILSDLERGKFTVLQSSCKSF